MVKLPGVQSTFLIHLICSYILLGLVLGIQILNYPMYHLLSAPAMNQYQQHYLIREFLLLLPFMIIELVTGFRLAFKVNNFNMHSSIRADLSIILSIWIITLVFALPSHLSLLHNGLSSLSYRTLVFTNIFRVLAWTVKCWFVTKMIRPMFAYDNAYEYEFLK